MSAERPLVARPTATLVALFLAGALGVACATGGAGTQASAAASAPAPAVAASPARPAPLVNPNQEANDRTVEKLMLTIAGHEKEPAGQVFKNIQLASLKGVPAERLLKIMNSGYSRALGVACAHCHVETDFALDDKRPKRVAREMAAMNRGINETLQKIESLERPPHERFVNCTTCHRGAVDPTAADR